MFCFVKFVSIFRILLVERRTDLFLYSRVVILTILKIDRKKFNKESITNLLEFQHFGIRAKDSEKQRKHGTDAD